MTFVTAMAPAGTQMIYRVHCPAKVNLNLSVGARDTKGYHPIRTVFQAIGLFDILDVEIGGNGPLDIEIAGAEIPADNTIAKAYRLSREVFRAVPSRLRLQKHIPMQSGLGGGSSDAAGLLRLLAKLDGRKASDPEIVSVAAAVGADVPFFLSGGRALGEGYGEQVTPLPDPPEQWYLVAKPAIGCSTAEMYARLDHARGGSDEVHEDDVLHNAFEQVAPKECLDLIERLPALGARDAALCGSGSAVFGRFAGRREAEDARASVEAESWVVKTLTRAESLSIETK